MAKPGVPQDGTRYLGIEANPRGSRTAQTELTYVGNQISPAVYQIVRRYHSWDRGLIDSFEAGIVAPRIISPYWTAFNTDGSVNTFTSIAAGTHDAQIDTNASACISYKQPMFLTFHQEPENDTATAGSAANYVLAWQRIMSRFATAGVTNVSWVWVLEASTFVSGDAEQYYPGDGIDWVGTDGYNWYTYHSSPWKTFSDVFSSFRDYAISKGKPAFIGEMGTVKDPADAMKKPAWYDDCLAQLKTSAWNQVKALNYFNSQPFSDSPPWWLDDDATGTAPNATDVAHWKSLASDKMWTVSTSSTGGGGVATGTRQTAGQIFPGGLVMPAEGNVFFGADDSWGFDTVGKPDNAPFTTHPGIEQIQMLDQRMAIRRWHFPFGSGPGSNGKFSWPTQKMIDTANLTNPKVMPFIAHGSQGAGANGFPVKTAGNGYTNTTKWNGFSGIDIITNGKFDTAYTDAFTRISQINSPVFFNLYMEMNIQAMGAYGGFQGGVSGAGQAAYIACYKHLRDLADAAGATNMIWVWCPANYDPDGKRDTYYPGAPCHWLAEDVYRHLFAGNVDLIYNLAVAEGKPYGIAESGFSETASNNTPNQSKVKMIQELAASILLPKYCETAFVIPWNFTGADPKKDDNLIDTTAAALAAYQTFAGSKPFQVYFGDSGGSTTDSTPPTAPTAISAIAGGASSVMLLFSGATDNVAVHHYEVWRATGAGAYAQIASPVAANYTDTGLTLSTTYHYKVKAVDAAGNKSPFSAIASATTAAVSGGLSTSPAANMPGFYSSAFDFTNNIDAGRMWDALLVNGVLYVCGESDHTIDNHTGTAVDRTNTPYLCAINFSTGAVIQTWLPNPNDVCRSLQLDASGTVLMVGGAFTSICGSSRHGIACLPVLSGPTDTTAASLDASMGDLSITGGLVTDICLQDANDCAWAVGTFTSAASATHNRVVRLKRTTGAWAVDTGFTGQISRGTAKRVRAKSDASKIVVGGDIPNSIVAFDGTTGAAARFDVQVPGETGKQHTISVDADDDFVCFGFNDQWQTVDWNGTGPTQFTNLTTGLTPAGYKGYWYFSSDGNAQACTKIIMGDKVYALLGHHGNYCMPKKNQDLGSTKIACDGIVAVEWGDVETDTPTFLEPPAFGQDGQNGSPLKTFNYRQDPVTGHVFALGDFTTANGSNKFYRLAVFMYTGWEGSGDTTAPVAPSNLVVTPISDTEIDLSWTPATDDVGVAGYQIIRNGVIVHTIPNASSYSDIGLAAGQTYSYQVKAFDSAGNVSTGTSTVQGSTSNSGGNTPSAPSNLIPPSLSNTTPVSGSAVSVIDGQWAGIPTPTLDSEVQMAPNTVAANLLPLCAYGMGAF